MEIGQKETVRAALNNPRLSELSFTFGEREFKVVDLRYDDYVTFLTLLQPVFQAVLGNIASARDLIGSTSAVATAMNPGDLVRHCASVLPDLAQLVCKQTDPSITVDDVKELARSPFKMANAVILQVQQNRMISEISDFFERILPLFKVT